MSFVPTSYTTSSSRFVPFGVLPNISDQYSMQVFKFARLLKYVNALMCQKYLQVIKHFTCNPPELLTTFLEHLTEEEWQGPDAITYVIRDLHHRLEAENRSVADFEFEVPHDCGQYH
jgi:hypothetical protein